VTDGGLRVPCGGPLGLYVVGGDRYEGDGKRHGRGCCTAGGPKAPFLRSLRLSTQRAVIRRLSSFP
jgi:hypothetical protein